MVGGQNNEATGAWATVIGGSTNVASGEYSLCAGLESTASGDYSGAIGRAASTNNKDGAMVLGDSNTVCMRLHASLRCPANSRR